MSDSALRRTIRRCTAALTIPISLFPLVFVAWLETDGYPYMNLVLEVADEIAVVVLLGSFLYLVASFGYQFAPTDPGTDGTESDA